MADRLIHLSRHLAVWLVALAAGVQDALNGIVALLHGQDTDAILWFAGAIFVFFLFHQVEKLKMFQEG